nr:MAG: ORF3 [Giant panda anellovirus]
MYHFFMFQSGNGEEQVQTHQQQQIPANNLQPVSSTAQYVLRTLPPPASPSSTHGTLTPTGSLQKLNSDNSFQELLQILGDYKEKKKRQGNRRKSTACPQQKKVQIAPAAARRGTKRRRRTIRNYLHSRREYTESESTDSSSSEGSSDW